MFPEIHVLDFAIPLYPIFVAIGFLVATFFLYKKTESLAISEEHIFPLMCFVECGVIVGGKLMAIIINFPRLENVISRYGFIGIFTRTGFVFYGGLFGGIFAIFCFARICKQIFFFCLEIVLSVTPLIHALGRLGCFCAGCCYGIEYSGFLSVYIHGSQRFPVQLLEALLLLILFLILQFFTKSEKRCISIVYFCGYGTLRLICEFFRGDKARGFIGPLSISAWISILCVFISTVLLLIYLRKQTEIIKDEPMRT